MQDHDATGRSHSRNTPHSPYATGCRIHKPEFDRARDAAEAWTGQEGGLDHWDLLDLLEAEGVSERFGLKTRHTDYLRASFKKLCREDFETGEWPPTVWMTKEKLARKVRVGSPRVVSDIEKDLARAGFIYWSDTASRRRDGKRSKHSGRISWAYGVDFSPFAAMAQQIEDTARLVEEEQIERQGLIHEIATIRCHTRILLQAALRSERAPAEAIRPLLDHVLALPAAKGMPSADVHALRSLAEDARLFQQHALALTEPPRTASEAPPAKETEGSDPMPPEDEKGTENRTPGYENLYPGVRFRDRVQFNYTPITEIINLVAANSPAEPSPEPQQPPAARLRPERGTGSPTSLDRTPVSGGPPAWLILDSLSPRLSRFLPAGRPPSADEFYQAANRTRSELGISPEAWRDACTALSPEWASIAVVVVASRDDAGEIHTSAGGFFRTLTYRARLGTLNLAGSLWGVIERHEQLHVARVTGPTEGEHSVPGPDSHPRIEPSPFDRQRADQATMTAILRTAEDPKGLAHAWRDLVARYRCWPFVDEVERHYVQLRGSGSGGGEQRTSR